MPADIRNFFGGKSSQGSAASPAKPAPKKEVSSYSPATLRDSTIV